MVCEFMDRDGLAIYTCGEGAPLLRLPYPHSYTLMSAAEDPLTRLLARPGRQLITFDPPGSYRSTRPARVDMAEMVGCTLEALDACGASRADLVGHSMGGLVALAFTLAYPERVRRLILIGSLAGGGRVVMRHRGLPLCWRPTEADFWRAAWWGIRLGMGWGSLALHARMLNLVRRASFVDKTRAEAVPVRSEDERRPAPVRARWPVVTRKLDYRSRLSSVTAPTLVCAGRYDPQAPIGCSLELANGIPGARLVVFERSGHYPFLEETPRFINEVEGFLTYA